jgi:hypothetical protein
MANQQLLDYVKRQSQQGVSKEELRKTLLTRGWSAHDIDEVFSVAHTGQHSPSTPQVPSPQPQAQQTSPETKQEESKKRGCLFWGLILLGVGITGTVIIGILAAVVLVAINPAAQLKKARNATRRNDAYQIQHYLDMYQVEKGSFPSELEELVPDYSSELPVDPETTDPYSYTVKEDGKDYELCVNFEAIEGDALAEECFVHSEYRSPGGGIRIPPDQIIQVNEEEN